MCYACQCHSQIGTSIDIIFKHERFLNPIFVNNSSFTLLFVLKEKLAKKGDINFGQIRMKSPHCTFAKKSFEGCSGKWVVLGNNEMLSIACGKSSNH